LVKKNTNTTEDETNGVFYQSKNLIAVHANAPNKYINKVMAILFTPNELANGIIVDENSRESTKTPLDNTKITLLKSLYLKLISC